MYADPPASAASPGKGLTIRQELADGEHWLRLEGAFNRATALELHRELELLDHLQVPRIVLDFSKVDELQELAIPSLTRGLESGSVRVVGLPNRSVRVFECFGWSGRNHPAARRPAADGSALDD